MADYIDREKLIESIKNDCHEQVYYTKEDAIDCIKSAISENVAPVVHGEWKYKEEWGRLVTNCCSICGQSLTTAYGERKMNFCPNCGAKMDAK